MEHSCGEIYIYLLQAVCTIRADLSDEELREDKDIVDPDAAGDSDAELEALLDKTAALVGKNKKKNKKKLKCMFICRHVVYYKKSTILIY